MPFIKLTYDQMIAIMTPTSPSVDRVLRHFAERTTMHGVPRIINAHSLPARIFWAVICVGAFGMFFWQTGVLMERYLSYPKKVNMEIIQKPVPFPSVTVCNTDHLDLQILQVIGDIIGFNEEISTKYKEISELENFRKAYNKFFDDAIAFVNINIMKMGMGINDIQKKKTMDKILEVNSRIGMTANLGKTMASVAGVKLEDFIMKCQFMTNECPINTSFTKVFDPYFYNCYTFEPESMVHTRNTRLQGVEYGLSLLLYSGSAGKFVQSEGEDDSMFVIPGLMESNIALSSGRGARVVIHSPGTRPHPTYDGFDIAPGMSITIGVKGRENVRIGSPHGNCTPECPNKQIDSPYAYTLMECQNKCIQNKIYKTCGCVDSHLPDTDILDHNKTEYCLKLPQFDAPCLNSFMDNGTSCQEVIDKWKTKFTCVKDMYDNLTIKDPGALDDCKCYPPCEDIIFDTSYSLSKLPDVDSKEASKYRVVIEGFFGSKISKDKRKLLEKMHGENFTEIVRQQVSRLNVHIADSNIIKTIEQPDYEAIRLVSDIGGQLGLWIGISVITLFEVLQLIVDLFHFITAKGRSVTERKSNGRALSNDIQYNPPENATDYRGMRYWDHRYSFKDLKPDNLYECDKLATV